MPTYRLSKLARLDLMEIADYTVDTWGQQQADRYLDRLVECFIQLSLTPGMGRSCEQVRTGYRRLEQDKHVIFYRLDQEGIFIGRILHERMMPSKHLFEGT